MGFGVIDPPPFLSCPKMWRSKKSKKPRQPSQEPASLGIPTHIATGVLGFHTTPDLGVRPEGTLRSTEIQGPMELISLWRQA